MATKQVNIDIIAKDKTRQAMSTATKGVDRLKSSVFNLQNALIGLGAGFVAKGFLDTAREVERLRVRFKFLFDDAKEGAKAFDNLVKFAGKVPFSLQEIQRGSANLAVVAKDAEELNKILEITGDIASASGLDFATTAEQIQRTFSSGINSADLFRERGVRALLGFEAGVAISAEKSKQHIMNAFRDGTLAVVGASADMAKTFDGTMSMLGDKFTQFQIKVMDSSPFEALKATAQLIEKSISDNFETIDKFAEKVGKTIVSVTAKFLLFGASVIDKFRPVFDFLGKSLSNLFNFVQGLPAPVGTLGIIGFFMLGTMGKLLVLTISGFFNNIRMQLGNIVTFIANMQEKMGGVFEALGIASDEMVERNKKSMESLKEMGERMQKPYEGLNKLFFGTGEAGKVAFHNLGIEINNANVEAGSLTKKLLEQFAIIDKLMGKNKRLAEFTDDARAGRKNDIPKQIEEVGMLEKAFSSFGKGFSEAVEKQKSGFKTIEDIGGATFGKLKQTLTDFVMTGKMNIGDLARFVVKSFIEMLVGEAVKMAFKKSLAMFKAKSIKEAMISLFSGAMKTFASIPFPFNVVAVGGALAFGGSLINKLKSFEKGGRPPIGQPSIVGEKGMELFVPNQAGTIIPNDKLGGSQPVTINFNISTVDARGFNELLLNSRGAIVNIINSAVNEKGRMAII